MSTSASTSGRPASTLVVRLESPYGRQRLEMDAHACLSDLSMQIQKRSGVEVASQILSFGRAGADTVSEDRNATLHEVGIRNGTQLYLRKSDAPVHLSAAQLSCISASCIRQNSADSRDWSSRAESAQAASLSGADADTDIGESASCVDAEMHESNGDVLSIADGKGETLGDEMEVACIHAFSGNVMCTVRVRPSLSLQMLAVRAQRQLYKEKSEGNADACLLFVEHGGQARVLDEKLLVEDVLGQNGGFLSCVQQPVEAATKALAVARRQRIFDSLEVYERTILGSLSDVPFGPELAAKVYGRLREGRRLCGWVTFAHRIGLTTGSQTDMWELCCGRAEYRRPDESKFTVAQQIGMFGRITFVERAARACGDVALCVGEHVEVWTDLDDFTFFWAAMSERLLAAYFSGILCSRERLPLGYLNENAWKISLDGTMTLSNFKSAARPLEHWER